MIRPVRNLILVELPKPEPISKGGIHIPEAAQRRLPKGIVRESGADYLNHECPYPVGATVYFSPYSGFDISVGEGEDKKDYLILNPEDIVAMED